MSAAGKERPGRRTTRGDATDRGAALATAAAGAPPPPAAREDRVDEAEPEPELEPELWL